MKSRLVLVSLGVASVLTFAFAPVSRADLSVDSRWIKKVEPCAPGKSPGEVLIVKQWHLGAGVDTHASKAPHPQDENQKAIYEQLQAWIQKEKGVQVFSEGCEGEIREGFVKKYNGWSLQDLQAQKASPGFSNIDTLVPLKLKAKFGDSLKVLCADRESLMKQTLLAFSDARGQVGFLQRVAEEATSNQGRNFLDGVIELYQLPRTTTREAALARLKEELKKSIQKIETLIEQRNSVFAEALKASQAPERVVVVGGLHAAGIQKLLETSGVSCKVLEPVGYQDDEKVLFEKLKAL